MANENKQQRTERILKEIKKNPENISLLKDFEKKYGTIEYAIDFNSPSKESCVYKIESNVLSEKKGWIYSLCFQNNELVSSGGGIASNLKGIINDHVHVVVRYRTGVYKPEIKYKGVLDKSLKLISDYFANPNGILIDTIFTKDSIIISRITTIYDKRSDYSIYLNGERDYMTIVSDHSSRPMQFNFDLNENFIICIDNWGKKCEKNWSYENDKGYERK